MITFKLEKFDEVFWDAQELFKQHWEEIALDKDFIPYSPNIDAYKALEAANILFVVTARQDGLLIGYYCGLIMPHLHYSTTLMQHSDVFFIAKTHRKGTTGIRLLREAEKYMKQRGVVKSYMMAKVAHKPAQAVLEYLGYTHVEKIYTKRLEDK